MRLAGSLVGAAALLFAVAGCHRQSFPQVSPLEEGYAEGRSVTMKRLLSKDAKERRFAVETLRVHIRQQDIPVLARLLARDESPTVVTEAASGLAQTNSDLVATSLAAQGRLEGFRLRDAAYALRIKKDGLAYRMLMTGTKNSDRSVRRTSLESLGTFKQRRTEIRAFLKGQLTNADSTDAHSILMPLRWQKYENPIKELGEMRKTVTSAAVKREIDAELGVAKRVGSLN